MIILIIITIIIIAKSSLQNHHCKIIIAIIIILPTEKTNWLLCWISWHEPATELPLLHQTFIEMMRIVMMMMMMMMVMVMVMVVVVMMMIVGLLAQACYWAASCTRHSFATQWQGDDDDYVECDDDNDDGGGDDDDSDLITTSVNMVTKRPENRSSLVNRLCKRICSEIVLSFFSK